MKQLITTILFLTFVVYAQEGQGFIQPVSGTVSSPIQDYRPSSGRAHEGIDIAADTGAPVVAAGGGTVRVRDAGGTGPGTGYDPNGYGDYVYIEHPDGTYTLYGHLDSTTVQDGQTVAQGQQIGTLGNTGSSSGPHLHFEISNTPFGSPLRVDGQYWDAAAGITDNMSVSQGSPINLGNVGTGPVTAGTPTPTPNIPNEPNAGGPAGVTPAPSFCGGNLPSSGGLDPSNLNLDTLLPTPTQWLRQTACILGDYQIPKHANNLGIALLFACFVYSLVNASYFFRTDEYFSLFARLAIAAGLVLGAPVVAKGVMNMWQGTYNFMQTNVVDDATKELETSLNELGPQLKTLGVITTVLNFAVAVIPDAGIDAVEEITANLAKFTSEGVRGLFIVMVLMGSIYGIYFLSIYVSGLTALLAGVLLPLLAPFLVLPGMISWFNRWFSMVFLALVTIVVMPFAFSVVVRLGITAPMVEVNTASQEMQTEFDAYLASRGLGDGVTGLFNPVNLVKFFASNTWLGAPNAISFALNMSQLYFKWMFALILLAMAVLASIFMLQQLPKLLAGFIGGTQGASASPVSGGALAGFFAGAALGAGGGAGKAAHKGLAKGKDKDESTPNNKSGPQPGGERNQQAALPPASSNSQAALPPAGGSGSGGTAALNSSSSSSRGNALPAASSSGGSGANSQRSLPAAGESGSSSGRGSNNSGSGGGGSANNSSSNSTSFNASGSAGSGRNSSATNSGAQNSSSQNSGAANSSSRNSGNSSSQNVSQNNASQQNRSQSGTEEPPLPRDTSSAQEKSQAIEVKPIT